MSDKTRRDISLGAKMEHALDFNREDEKEEMARLGRDSWQYDNTNSLNSFIKHLATLEPECDFWPEYDERYWQTILKTMGGKGLGLEICEHMAIIDKSGRLSVPKWEQWDESKYKEIDLWRIRSERDGNGLLLRSSAPQEDWLDSASGTFDTKRLQAMYGGNLPKLEPIPYIVQERKVGYGLVVDIVYSDLLKRNVVKIASGTGMSGSATNNNEAHVAVFDFENGDLLDIRDSFKNGSEEKSLFTDQRIVNTDFPKDLANTLVEIVRKMRINFGVQLEMKIDPRNLEEWNLLQIRPTPGSMRGDVNFEQKDCGQKKFETCVVSGVFDISAPFRIMKREGIQEGLEVGIGAGGGGLEEEDLNRYRPRSETQPFIAVFDPEVRMDQRTAPSNIAEAYLRGAEAQVLCSPIKPVASHGAQISGNFDNLNTTCNRAIESSGFLSLGRDKMDELIEILVDKKESVSGRVVSDGVVGSVIVK